MRRHWLAAAGVFLLVGCGSSGSDDGGTAATPASSEAVSSTTPPPAPTAYEFTRHAFAVDVPPGWTVSTHDGTWVRIDQFGPNGEVPGEDVVVSPDGASFLVANAMTIPAGMTGAAWQNAFAAAVAPRIPADCSSTTSTAIVGAEQARVLEQRCDDSVFTGRSLVHGDQGYYFTTRGPEDDEATLATLDGIVESIRFVDS